MLVDTGSSTRGICVAQLLLMAAFHEPMQEVSAQAARLLAEVVKTGGLNYVAVFVVYLAAP